MTTESVTPAIIYPTTRYEGALTMRPLPFDDPEIDALSPELRAEVALHWQTRAASERRVGLAFAFVKDTLRDAGAPETLISLATRAVDDERRHTELARQVASRYAGHDVGDPPTLPLQVPEHRGASVAFKRTLHVIGQCALNETFASAVLESALHGTTAKLAHAAVRELLADEIDHARIGWGYLASRSSSEKAQLTPWLVPMVQANVNMWRAADRATPSDESMVRHGAISPKLVDDALVVAIRDLVIPGFKHVGVDTRTLEKWAADGMWNAAART
jgi:hypothetical protein